MAGTIDHCWYVQFVFRMRWEALRHHGRQHGRLIIGVEPEQVGYDSADAWAHRTPFVWDSREGRAR